MPSAQTGMLSTSADPVLTAQPQSDQPIRPDTSNPGQPSAGMLSDWYANFSQSASAPAPAPSNVPEATAAVAGTTDWQPGSDATVQGQLTTILDKGSPLMDRAATKALQGMNQRGLLNSSIAVGAGQSALYDAAMPIAQQDAAVNADAGKFNAGAKNTAALTNAGLSTDVSKFNAGSKVSTQQQEADFAHQERMQTADIGSRYDLANMDAQTRIALQKADAENQQKLQAANAVLQMGLQASDNAVKQSMQAYQLAVQQQMQGKDNETKLALATLDANTQTTLADINNRFRAQLQGSQSMAASYQSMVDGITRIMVDPNMDAGAKQAAINNLTTLYNNALSMQSQVTGLELGSLLTPGDLGGGAAPAPAPAPAPTPEGGYPDYPGAFIPGGRGYGPDNGASAGE